MSGHSGAMILSETDSFTNGVFMLVMVLCAVMIMLMLLRRRQSGQTTQRDVGREQLTRIREQHRLRQSMDDMLLQLEELARRVGALVDTKLAKLETVVRDADDRLKRLHDLLGRPAADPSQTRPADTSPEREPGGTGGSPGAVRATPPRPAAQAPPDHGPDIQQLGSAQHSADRANAGDLRFRRVYELVDGGVTPGNAAEQLGMSLGEVELILNLRELR